MKWKTAWKKLHKKGLIFALQILNAATIFAFISILLFSSTPRMKKGWKRTALAGWGVLCLA
ncbi:MAG: hypothetical protein II461_09205, partial [Treponema sp.]|nr:hypothetical protein [Treponema sp.]